MKLCEAQEQGSQPRRLSSTQPKKYKNEENLSSDIQEDPNAGSTCCGRQSTTKQAPVQLEVLASPY